MFTIYFVSFGGATRKLARFATEYECKMYCAEHGIRPHHRLIVKDTKQHELKTHLV